jgi:hypothetical protein
MFNYTYPKGDLGGNYIKISKPDGSEVNLHAFWDAGAFIFENDILVRPFNETASKFMEDKGN